MAQILVAADRRRAGQRWLLGATVDAVRSDGHEAVAVDEEITQAVEDADAVIALEADSDPVAAACLAAAAGRGKPSLHLHGGQAAAAAVTGLATHSEAVHDADGLDHALAGFYDRVRPFAGRLVRDRIPHLVREAGHDVRFRPLDDEEKPHFLKQKLATEAQQLQRATIDKEKEELGDLLEVLESLIRVRGYDRDELKMVKQAKLKRRGGFEKCYVVESTAQGPQDGAREQADDHASGADRPAGSGAAGSDGDAGAADDHASAQDEPGSASIPEGHGRAPTQDEPRPAPSEVHPSSRADEHADTDEAGQDPEIPLADGVLPEAFRDGDAPSDDPGEDAGPERRASRLFEV